MYERTRVTREEQDARKRGSAPEIAGPEMLWQPPDLTAYNPRALNAATVLQMQQRLGNAAVQRMLAKYRPKRAPTPVIRRQEDDEEQYSSPADSEPESESTSEEESAPESQSDYQPVAEEEYTPENESEESAESEDSETQPATAEEDSDTEAESEEAPESESDTESATDENTDTDDTSDTDQEEHTRDIYVQGESRTVTVEGSATGRTSSVLEVGATTTATYSGDLKSAAMVNGNPPNVKVSGTATCTYTVDCKKDLPTPPSNLEGCEKKEYQKAIGTVLRKHEDEHEKRFKTYEGTTTHKFSETVADENDIDAILDKKFLVPNMDSRSAAADTLSGKIDPFNFKADLSACDSPNKKV